MGRSVRVKMEQKQDSGEGEVLQENSVNAGGDGDNEMKPRFYTELELRELLEGDEISDQFRTDIEAALKEGTDAAIRSLGYFAMSARPTPDESLAFRQAEPKRIAPHGCSLKPGGGEVRLLEQIIELPAFGITLQIERWGELAVLYIYGDIKPLGNVRIKFQDGICHGGGAFTSPTKPQFNNDPSATSAVSGEKGA